METLEILNILEGIYLSWGLPIVFLSSLVEISPFGWIVPGGAITAIGGFFAFGRTNYLLAILIFSWSGAWLTFILAYIFGLKTGNYLVEKLKQQKNAKRAEYLLKEHGPIILTTSMMAGLTRFWVAYVAGLNKYRFIKFLFYSGSASLTWTSLMVTIGYLAGSERANLEAGITKLGILSWVFLLLALLVIYIKTKSGFKEYLKNEKANN